jgi:hypothetical protein
MEEAMIARRFNRRPVDELDLENWWGAIDGEILECLRGHGAVTLGDICEELGLERGDCLPHHAGARGSGKDLPGRASGLTCCARAIASRVMDSLRSACHGKRPGLLLSLTASMSLTADDISSRSTRLSA